jgi:hypothetical protein
MKAIVVVAVFVLGTILLVALASPTKAQPAGRTPSAKWEYKTAKRPDDPKEFEDALNQVGQDGWEYCDMQPMIQKRAGQASVEVKTLVFKRVKQ